MASYAEFLQKIKGQSFSRIKQNLSNYFVKDSKYRKNPIPNTVFLLLPIFRINRNLDDNLIKCTLLVYIGLKKAI